MTETQGTSVTDQRPWVVLTGASGFVGRALVLGFLNAGFRVRALVRSPRRLQAAVGSAAAQVDCVPWELGDSLPPQALAPAPAAFVHAAFEAHGSRARVVTRNVEGTRRLLQAVKAAGPVFCVFVSSFSAGEAADAGLRLVSTYSRAKQQTEKLFDPARDLILRPGLVVGPGANGLFARMRAQLKRGLPLPLFYRGESPVQWIRVEELVGMVVHGVERRTAGLYSVASPDALSLMKWSQAVARALGTKARLVRVPNAASDVIAWLLRGAERLGIRLPISADTVYGLKYARPVDTRGSLERLGESVSDLESALRNIA